MCVQRVYAVQEHSSTAGDSHRLQGTIIDRSIRPMEHSSTGTCIQSISCDAGNDSQMRVLFKKNYCGPKDLFAVN